MLLLSFGRSVGLNKYIISHSHFKHYVGLYPILPRVLNITQIVLKHKKCQKSAKAIEASVLHSLDPEICISSKFYPKAQAAPDAPQLPN